MQAEELSQRAVGRLSGNLEISDRWQITFGRKNVFSQVLCYTVYFVFHKFGRPLTIVYCIYSQISGPKGKEMVLGKINKSMEYYYPLWAWQITGR